MQFTLQRFVNYLTTLLTPPEEDMKSLRIYETYWRKFSTKIFSKIITILSEAKATDVTRVELVESINISKTSITALPENLKEMTNLKIMFACDTPLLELKIDYLPNSLTSLYLARTKLKRLSASIQKMNNLEFLDLCSTPLKSLPPELTLLPKLSNIIIRNVNFDFLAYYILSILVDRECEVLMNSDSKIFLKEIQMARKKLPDANNYWNCYHTLSTKIVTESNPLSTGVEQLCRINYLVDNISSYCGYPFEDRHDHARFFKRVATYQPLCDGNNETLNQKIRCECDFFEKTVFPISYKLPE